jgi:hypothetical protein
VVEVPADHIEAIPGAGADDALGDEIAAIDDQLVMLLNADRALGRALPAPPAGDQPADEPETGPEGGPETTRSPRPTGAPPARRRSAATPQVPRSRRRPGGTKDREE